MAIYLTKKIKNKALINGAIKTRISNQSCSCCVGSHVFSIYVEWENRYTNTEEKWTVANFIDKFINECDFDRKDIRLTIEAIDPQEVL